MTSTTSVQTWSCAMEERLLTPEPMLARTPTLAVALTLGLALTLAPAVAPALAQTVGAAPRVAGLADSA